MEGYDAERQVASAFMVKEMGDGFICSVGFPFAPPSHNKALTSISLAERFIQEFNDVMQQLNYRENIYCGIGIAMGPVSGFFSQSGVIRYDLFGRGIVLATRYEALRKKIFDELKLGESNIIVIQEKVFCSLPRQERQQFAQIRIAHRK